MPLVGAASRISVTTVPMFFSLRMARAERASAVCRASTTGRGLCGPCLSDFGSPAQGLGDLGDPFPVMGMFKISRQSFGSSVSAPIRYTLRTGTEA